jgi:cytoskeleton protein RodZ
MIESLDVDESQPKKDFSPGQLLSQGRLQAGLTQEQVAKELYMTVYKVKALEADDYSRLSSDTFARGYIRAYANFVKVDVVVALAAYDQLIEGLKPKATIPVQVTVAESAHRGAWQFLAVIGAFFLGLWLISVWFFDNRSEAEYRVAPAAISSVAVVETNSSLTASLVAASEVSQSSISAFAVSSSDAKPLVGANSSSALKLEIVAGASSVAGSNGSVSSIAVVQEKVASSLKKMSLDEINFSFRAESWLEVSDSRGDVLATELQPAGSKIKLVGLAPFDVKLGNAPAVDIQLNGKKIDVIPLLGSNVLILKVGN